ncbi:MAG TPA: hypothetical protein VOA41_19370 [Candidatus Dormibacteraeota bacterium]|nr:hypothetical protein [Candidatus Dormibacteraeota bacterium]
MRPERSTHRGSFPGPAPSTSSSTVLDEHVQTVTMNMAFPSKGSHAVISSSLRARRRASICEATVETCRKHFKSDLQAVALTGSLARDEASFLELPGRGTSVLGDAEFPLVFHPTSRLPTRKYLDQVQTEVETKLGASKLFCTIGLTACHPSYLRNLRPHIYAYELRNCGDVVWGSPRVLSLIPEFAPSEIPVEDGWRLLSNRMIEHLDVAGAAVESGQPLSPEVLYNTVKLSVDMATSFLLFCGLYAPTYHKRCERLRTLAKAGGSEFDPPFSLKDFAELVDWATRCKLSPDSALASADRQFWSKTVTFALALWQWELARLTGREASDPADPQALMRRWMRKQSFYDRARGWASLLRRLGWKRSIRSWPRWVRLAWQASPRHCVYSATSELFSALPTLAASNAQGESSRVLRGRIRRWIPLSRPSSRSEPSEWRNLVSDVLWNYREFLKETRS